MRGFKHAAEYAHYVETKSGRFLEALLCDTGTGLRAFICLEEGIIIL